MKRSVLLALCALMVVSLVNCQNKKVPVASHSLKSVYFDYDQSFIRSDSAQTLQGNAAYLKSNSARVTVEGHCDNRGSNEYNLALGQHRADSARNYIVNLGVSSSRINTVSYGEEKQVCYEQNENCWWKNRRADFRRH